MKYTKKHPILLRMLLVLIMVYQRTLSPDHGIVRFLFPFGVCRYSPTCSQFMRDAILMYGWRGVWVGARRVLRCHPYAQGGHDPASLYR